MARRMWDPPCCCCVSAGASSSLSCVLFTTISPSLSVDPELNPSGSERHACAVCVAVSRLKILAGRTGHDRANGALRVCKPVPNRNPSRRPTRSPAQVQSQREFYRRVRALSTPDELEAFVPLEAIRTPHAFFWNLPIRIQRPSARLGMATIPQYRRLPLHLPPMPVKDLIAVHRITIKAACECRVTTECVE